VALRRWIAFAAVALALGGCASVHNYPGNKPIAVGVEPNYDGHDSAGFQDDILVGLAFSGGGTRAAAYAFGVIKELDRTEIRDGLGRASLLDRIDFISGVSGGSVTAAYFGLKKRDALRDFRERFLIRNAEENLETQVSLTTLGRALGGGVNTDSQFTNWLDRNLFEGATLAELHHQRRPRIWINASDIYNRAPFVFGKTAFEALCSDLLSYRVSDAVAASAAVPVVFAPVVLETYPNQCTRPLPAWIDRARQNPHAQPLLKGFADATAKYRDGSMRYVKLLDGGLVDNFGLSGFTIGLLSAQRPFEPLSERQAAHMRRMLFLIVDAGRGPAGDWHQKLEGPAGADLVLATADTAIDAGTKAGYTAFNALMSEWADKIRKWRCGLEPADRKRLGLSAGWRCNDLRLHVDRLGFDTLGPARGGALLQIPTRFALPQPVVDDLIEAGGETVRKSAVFQSFRKGL
jgi:NTE family protein